MKRVTIAGVAALALIGGCDITRPFHAMSAPQTVSELGFDNLGSSQFVSAEPTEIVVDLWDKNRDPVDTTGQKITWSSSDANVASVSGSSAVATITGKKAGTAEITATSANGKTGSTTVTVIPGTATKIAASLGSGQQIIQNELPVQSFVAVVSDVNDNPVAAGVSVSWSLNGGSASTIATNSSGQSAANIRPSVLGTGTVVASLPGTSATASFTYTCTTLELGVVTAPPATAAQGVALSPAPIIELRYASDHNAYKRQGVSIVASATTTPGPTVGGTATVASDANGRATFSNLSLSGTAGAATLKFTTTAPAATVTAAAATTLAAGAPTNLGLATAPSVSSVSGQSLTTQPVVQVRDASSNSVSQSGIVVAATVISPTTGVTISNATATTDATGKATFASLTATGAAGTSYTLRFSATGLTSVDASAVALTGPATKLVVTQQPSAFQCGATLNFSVRAQDAASRNVSLPGLSIALTSGIGVTVTNGTATTDATGLATFTGVKLTTATAGTYTLTFTPTPAGLTPVNLSVDIVANAASKLKLTTEPSTTAVNGSPLAAVPVVRLVDACDLFVSQSSVVVSVSAVTGSPTFSPATASTNSLGQATFTGLTMTGTAGSYTLQFASTGLTSVSAAAPTVLGGAAATQMVITTAPPTGALSGVALTAAPVVQLKDATNANVALAGVSITASASGASFTSATATTDATGKATFTGLVLSGTAQTAYPLVFSASGFPAVTASTGTMVATPASNNVTLTGLAAGAGVLRYYGVNVTAGAAPITITMTNATAVDIWARKTDVPTTSLAVCATSGTATKTCTISSPTSGHYYILLSSSSSYSGVALTVTW